MARLRIEDTVPDIAPYKLVLPAYALTTYPVRQATSSGRSFTLPRKGPRWLYPENVKGRPLFPKHGYSRLCSATGD